MKKYLFLFFLMMPSIFNAKMIGLSQYKAALKNRFRGATIATEYAYQKMYQTKDQETLHPEFEFLLSLELCEQERRNKKNIWGVRNSLYNHFDINDHSIFSLLYAIPLGLTFADNLDILKKYNVKMIHKGRLQLHITVAQQLLMLGIAYALRGEDPLSIIEKLRNDSKEDDREMSNSLHRAIIAVQQNEEYKISDSQDVISIMGAVAYLFLLYPYNVKGLLEYGNRAYPSSIINVLATALVGARVGNTFSLKLSNEIDKELINISNFIIDLFPSRFEHEIKLSTIQNIK